MGREHAEPSPQPKELTDLLARAAQGEDDAWRQLIAQYSRRIFALCRSRLNSVELAEEITQSVFVTVARKVTEGGYIESGRFEPWLFRVVMNRIRDEIRRRNRAAHHASSPVEQHADPIPFADEPPEDLLALRQAISQLPAPDREVIELRHHAQLSFKDIADLTQEPIGTLLARHHRALRKLRAMLESRSISSESGNKP
ncbi:MAG: sigma-70 family RNA polymerase sigma factor [Phycisphaeraceae bacterium]|nr:sigma-70 family RNA polymerase sigma factor [Phycisphaeraceae bacterium]MCW5763293.1 sigma-70 family RNA polymerase sigma factor [Phycisphaeraceae bacterium]